MKLKKKYNKMIANHNLLCQTEIISLILPFKKYYKKYMQCGLASDYANIAQEISE